MQTVDKNRTVDLFVLNQRDQYLTSGVEKLLQIPFNRGLDCPDTDQSVLNRLVGNPWFVIDKPVQNGCLDVLVLFQSAFVT